jgi:hypothetical protein
MSARFSIILTLILSIATSALSQEVSLTMYNTDSGAEVGKIVEGSSIIIQSTQKYSIVANVTNSNLLRRVVLLASTSSGKVYKKRRSRAPYALFGSRRASTNNSSGITINGRVLRGKTIELGGYNLEVELISRDRKSIKSTIRFNLTSGGAQATATPGNTSTPPPQPSFSPTIAPSPVRTNIPTPAPTVTPTTTNSSGVSQIRVSSNKRFFEKSDGSPFFYLGDTAWRLFLALNRADAELYLENRRQRGFNVIQAVALSELGDCGRSPNAQGDIPLNNNNPGTPRITPGENPNNQEEYDYWDHMDYIIKLASSKGMYIGLLPAWGEYVNNCKILNTSNANAYGRFIGERYKNYSNIIWIIGGDRNPENADMTRTWQELARGIEQTAGDTAIMTYHPWGRSGSSAFFHNESWLDFNMWQSGHWMYDMPVHQHIRSDYNRTPTKPTLDGEPNYEDHPLQSNRNQWFRDHDTRKAAYRAVFAGAAGHTYGHHAIWQFCTRHPNCPGSPVGPDRNWTDAINRPGGAQVQYLKKLMLSRPYFSRIPDTGMLPNNDAEGKNRKESTRDSSGSYGFVYLPEPGNFSVNLSALSGANIQSWWFNPRTGQSTKSESFAKTSSRNFTTPAGGPDWVLVLDDSSKGYSEPGQ